MTAAAHQVVGLIDISSEVDWSADAIVSECLGTKSSLKNRERLIISRRLPARSTLEVSRLSADLSQLQDDLDQLLESFLINSLE